VAGPGGEAGAAALGPAETTRRAGLMAAGAHGRLGTARAFRRLVLGLGGE
jgi:hypothetical protein